MRRRRASSRTAERVGPSSVSAPASRPSSGPMYAKFSGSPTSFAPRSAASSTRRSAVAEVPRPVLGRGHLDGADEVSR